MNNTPKQALHNLQAIVETLYEIQSYKEIAQFLRKDPDVANLLDGITDDEILPVMESLFISKAITQVIDTTPKMNRNELQAAAQPADLLITVTPKKIIDKKNALGKLFAKAVRMTQRSPFNSSKMVTDNQTLIGYGLSLDEGLPFVQASFEEYLNKLDACLLLRHREITPKASKNIVKWVKAREGVTYAPDQLIKTLANRVLREKIQLMLRKDPRKHEGLMKVIRPMICSSILAVAYSANDIEFDTNVKNLNNIWPRDFVVSPSFETIALLDPQNQLT